MRMRLASHTLPYQKEPLRDIAMYHMVKEDAVEKAKRRAQEKLGEKMSSPEENK